MIDKKVVLKGGGGVGGVGVNPALLAGRSTCAGVGVQDRTTRADAGRPPPPPPGRRAPGPV